MQEQTQARKHSFRDKKHGWYLKDQDSYHIIMPYVLGDRTDNEAVLSEEIDITALTDYINGKNADNPDFKYTWFHAISAALAKVLIQRPKMNYYISGRRMYEHKDITLAFVVKRLFADNGGEHLAKIKVQRQGDSPISQVYSQVKAIVTKVKGTSQSEGITKKFDLFQILPRPFMKMLVGTLKLMEYFGDSPDTFKADDPLYSSIFISNLGSIKMNANYHHLSNWGDNSFFVVIGEKKKRPIFNEDGTYEMRDTISLSMTIDERIADGYYYAKSIKMLKYLLQNPDLLDLPAEATIEFE